MIIAIICFALTGLCLILIIVCLACKLHEKPSYCFFIPKKPKSPKPHRQNPTSSDEFEPYEPFKRIRPIVPYQPRQRMMPLRYLSADAIY